jgi:micrococcal nuclease
VVTAVTDGETVRLNDGTTLRLINALAPRDAPALAAATRAWLEDTLLGSAVWFGHGGRQEDRHGRLLVHLFRDVGEGSWIQGEMVDRGLARVYSFADNRACVGELLAREVKARQMRRGLWAHGYGAILPAEPPDMALAQAGRFAIVEGTVLSVGERRLRTYLNFGTYWNVDFTVIVLGRDRDRIAESGMNLGELAERRIRVRGWILDDRGPAMTVTHPEKIEIVDNR